MDFSNLLFLPIDIEIPKFTLNRSGLYKIPPQIHQPKWWDTVIINSDPERMKIFKPIVDQLPYIGEPIIMHKFQNMPVGPHFDVYPGMKNISKEEYENISHNEPCGYRLVINGNVDRLSLWDGVEWITPILPSVPCCYLINASRMKHQVSDDPGREIVYIRGIVDSEMNKALIQKSLLKYKEHAVYIK